MTVKLTDPEALPLNLVCVCVLRGQAADGTFHMPYQVNLEMARRLCSCLMEMWLWEIL